MYYTVRVPQISQKEAENQQMLQKGECMYNCVAVLVSVSTWFQYMQLSKWLHKFA